MLRANGWDFDRSTGGGRLVQRVVTGGYGWLRVGRGFGAVMQGLVSVRMYATSGSR